MSKYYAFSAGEGKFLSSKLDIGNEKNSLILKVPSAEPVPSLATLLPFGAVQFKLVEICKGGCNDRGDCGIGHVCKCRQGFNGLRCENIDCPKNCSDHGTCNGSTGACDCQDGWEGEACDQAEGSGSTGKTVGIVLGVLAAVIVVGLLLYMFVLKRAKDNSVRDLERRLNKL
jgi:hypothetical protein